MIKQRATTKKTASATLTIAEIGDILCSSSSAQTYTLPTATKGLWYNFSNIGVGMVAISNGSTTLAEIEQYQQALAINDGSAWYVSLGGGNVDNFLDLEDTPDSFSGSAGKVLKVNTNADGIEFGDPQSGGVTSFTGLNDVPDSYVGQGGKVVRVKSTADGIEFADAAAAGGGASGNVDGGTPSSIYPEGNAQNGSPTISVSASRALALTDMGSHLMCLSASAITVTVPTNASVAFPVDTEIMLSRYGTGTVTFAGETGVTIKSADSKLSIEKQYKTVVLKKIATDEWLLFGALA